MSSLHKSSIPNLVYYFAMGDKKHLDTIVILLAAGNGTRYSATHSKIFANIYGKPVIQRTLENLMATSLIDQIIIVVRQSDLAALAGIVQNVEKSTSVKFVIGGATRSESAWNALKTISHNEAKVLIHDGVRPFVSKKIFEDCIEALNHHSACDVVIPTSDTVVEESEGFLKRIPDRKILRRGQTPQGFILSKIREAYDSASQNPHFDFFDDCSVFMEKFPMDKVVLVKGDDKNIKITTFSDLIHAESIIGMSSIFQFESLESSKREIKGNPAVVFGASSGIGKLVLEELLEMGSPAMGVSRRLTGTDIRDAEAIRSVLEEASEELGPIKHLFNCVGEIGLGSILEKSYEEMEHILLSNVMGTVTLFREALPFLAGNQGSFISVSSSAAPYGREEQAIYSASKAAIENLTQSFADQVKNLGLKVNAIRPARTATLRREQVFGKGDSKLLLCPRFVALSMIRVASLDCSGKIFPLSIQDQNGIQNECAHCLNQNHS